jgi:hypothetical protein
MIRSNKVGVFQHRVKALPDCVDISEVVNRRKYRGVP